MPSAPTPTGEDLASSILSLVAAPSSQQPCSLPRDDAGWDALDALAAQHRLQPLLHHRANGRAGIPPSILHRWADERRRSALIALHQKRELLATVGLLREGGFSPVALKGAWLAWHAYPEPALRPMRDIDILLSRETAIPAYQRLLDAGYRRVGPAEISLEDSLRLDKHLPALLSPRGVVIELHQRLWEIDGRMDHTAPDADDAAFLSRCEEHDGVLFPAPQDMLAHLIIHAVYDHRLDCGGLVLSDIAFLLHGRQIDWDRFWAEARARHYERGALLVLSLVRDRHDATAPLAFPADRPALPPQIIETSSRLLFQDLETRQSAGVYATLRAAGFRRFVQRLLARRSAAHDRGQTVSRDLAADGGYLRWAFSRLRRTLGEFTAAEVMGQARDLSRLSRWLVKSD